MTGKQPAEQSDLRVFLVCMMARRILSRRVSRQNVGTSPIGSIQLAGSVPACMLPSKAEQSNSEPKLADRRERVVSCGSLVCFVIHWVPHACIHRSLSTQI